MVIRAVIGVSIAAPVSAGSRNLVAARQIEALGLSYDRFVLPNGLRVVVHTDRKAPVVSVNLSYAVGSMDEGPGEFGFAHLFEHLMFHAGPYSPRGWVDALGAIGATGINGNTTPDATYFYETVPTGALARTLFLEADRMRSLGTRIDQAALDVNRAIVQNEKRQVDNQPMGTSGDIALARLLPPGHPFGHPVLGDMVSLDSAEVGDVSAWHRRHYSPNNAVLVLTGDVDAASARRLVLRYFGDIARRPLAPRPTVRIIVPATAIADSMTDQVAAVTVTRHWIVPGLDRPDGLAIDMAAKVLGGLSGVWLDEVLRRRERLVGSVIASSGATEDLGTFIVSYTVAPGVDPALAAHRVDELLARFLRNGPSEEELRRVTMREIGWRTQSVEPTIGQGSMLVDGEIHHGDPLHYQRRLRAMAALDPASVRAAAARWLTRPAFTVTVRPGNRPAYAEATARPAVAPGAVGVAGAVAPARPLPPVGTVEAPAFPRVERTVLRNGIAVVVARRTAVPLTRITLDIAAGANADSPDRPGTRRLLLGLLPEGAGTRDAKALSAAREELGADWLFEAGPDRITGTLTVTRAGLAPALAIFADMVRRPSLTAQAVADGLITAAEMARQSAIMPGQTAGQALETLLYGANSPYARSALSDPASIMAITREDITALHRRWFRPEAATLFVVSDLPLERLRAALEVTFGDWTASAAPGVAPFPSPVTATPQIVLIDRPGSPQSVIAAAIPTTLGPRDDLIPLNVANDALGGTSGRLNMDLRERHGWTYGIGGSFVRRDHGTSYMIETSVQSDRTGASIAVIRNVLTDWTGSRPITQAEADQVRSRAIASLPGRYERGDAVLAAIRANALLGRPDDEQAHLLERYRALGRYRLATAMAAALNPDRMLWVVVGDARTVAPQLRSLSLPVEVRR